MLQPATDAQIKRARILIIEDDRVNAQLLTHCLNQAGYSNVAHATDGNEGITMMEQLPPDVIVLDIIMPHMDGFAFIKQIRKIPRFTNIPIIFQTVLNEENYKLRAFEMGATDYIAKPLSQLELLARLKVHLLNKMLIEQLINTQHAMKNELNAARSMQDQLLPSDAQISQIQTLYTLEIARHFETSSILGGDCWGMRPLDEHRLAFYMLDLSGHGVSAAMNVFRLHTLIQDMFEYMHDASAFMTHLGEAAYSLFARHEFASMFYGVIDIKANSLQYAVASAPPAILFRTQDSTPVTLSGRGLPLGAVPNARYASYFVPFMQNDTLLLFSDCLIETPDRHGCMLDEILISQQVAKSLSASQHQHAHSAIDHLLAYFRKHSGSTPVRDDLTINIYHRN